MLSLYYLDLMGNIEEHEGKTHLMVDGYMLDKTLDKIKMVLSIEKTWWYSDFDLNR